MMRRDVARAKVMRDEGLCGEGAMRSEGECKRVAKARVKGTTCGEEAT